MLKFLKALGCILVIISFNTCSSNIGTPSYVPDKDPVVSPVINEPIKEENKIPIRILHDVKVLAYFQFMDSLIAACDTLVSYDLSEYILVHSNPWILDTLRSFDYYKSKKRGIFIYDQRELIVLHRNDTLWLPGERQAMTINDRLKHTVLDLNLPEYILRIFVYDSLKHIFPVRIGVNGSKYLETIGKVVDLKTPIGEGEIVRINRYPDFVNPARGNIYSHTRRDDGELTCMPQIPWLEPSINGIRHGSLIHPTTNQETLGKAYSHGCIGTTESDAWTIYYLAPLKTKVRFRYDLRITNEQGDSILLRDIYDLE